MREFSKFSPKIWQSQKFKALPFDSARYLYLYLHSCPHQNSSGCTKLPTGYALEDLAWEKAKFEECLKLLCEHDFIICDDATSEVYIKSWYSTNAPTNKNHAKGILKQILRIDSKELSALARSEVQSHLKFGDLADGVFGNELQEAGVIKDLSHLLNSDKMKKYK